MISIVKELPEIGVTPHVLNFLKTHKQVNKSGNKPTPFATPAVYNTPAGQEVKGNMFTQNEDTSKNIR